ncbi:MAG: hypothetical protein EOS41_14385 [Mesorhizobium sp.]|uniref:TRAFAC clade GTPase domain-containing protein n=1 Tax=Mesorhizobium sp. TaxID=1871066 RepID=UPI000FE6DB0F|nr:hypothetical protein [Mesorhizobium sp.]RWE24774.1 MAG: hypothetical protein EOS41_14385 [Mesorhizobium sp.]
MAHGSPCRNVNCDVAKSGVCALDNDPIDSCSEYLPDEVALDHGDDENEPLLVVRPVEPKRFLHRSDMFNRSELWSMQKAEATTTVSLIGDVKAGKTTLIAALYSSFCKGPFAGYSFRSSRTLTAFARRHHKALERSDLPLPATDRTSRQDGVGFFHLNVVGQSGPRHLLVADRSGEDFRAARRDTKLVAELWELAMADRICFMLDAGKLSKPETRAGYKRKFKQQIWALLNNGAIPEKAALEIVSTKLDKLAPRPSTEPILDELIAFENTVIEEFKAAGRMVGVSHVCAMPRSNFGVGLIGLEKLFQGWLEPRAVKEIAPLPAVDPLRWVDKMLS